MKLSFITFIFLALLAFPGRGIGPPVLFFVPVGMDHVDAMGRNVAALSKSYPSIEFFFAHYDGTAGQKAYQKHDWYRDKIGSHFCTYKGFKPEFIYKEIISENKLNTDPWLKRFEFVWVSDDNIDFTHTNAANLVNFFQKSGAAIGQPAIQHSYWAHLTWPQAPGKRECAVRYVPLVEVMTPIFTREALAMVYGHLFQHDKGATQDMGMDEVWCAFLAAKLPAYANSGNITGERPISDGRTACVVIDESVAVKLPHEGHSYSTKAAQTERRRVHSLFEPYIYPSKGKEATRGACVALCPSRKGQVPDERKAIASGKRFGQKRRQLVENNDINIKQHRHSMENLTLLNFHEGTRNLLMETKQNESSSSSPSRPDAPNHCHWDNFRHKVQCGPARKPATSQRTRERPHLGWEGSAAAQRRKCGPEPQHAPAAILANAAQKSKQALEVAAAAKTATRLSNIQEDLDHAACLYPALESWRHFRQGVGARYFLKDSIDPRLTGEACF